MRRLLLVLIISFNISIHSEEKKITAEDYLNLDTEKAFSEVRKLSKSETDALITQIRQVAKKEWKDADKFYLLISHLETIRAIEEEQNRLKSLNLVYTLGLILFTSSIFFSYLSQRKSLKQIREITK